MIYLFVRLILWIGLPLLLVMLLVGPDRVKEMFRRGWALLFSRRLEPAVLLGQVVRQHVEHVASVKRALAQAEAAEREIDRNLQASKANITLLEKEARDQVTAGDELGAKAALYKLNLERLAANSFQEQRTRQHESIADSRKRLYMLELQLRQYEVGRTVLLSQLEQAKTLEQQYDIANEFDPFNAVANWRQAEGLVHEKALNAHAKERVFADTSESGGHELLEIDAPMLEAQLNELRRLCRPDEADVTNGIAAPADGLRQEKTTDPRKLR